MGSGSGAAQGIVRHWQTRDVDEAASGLSTRFAHARHFRIRGQASAFRLQCSAVELDGLRLIRASNSGYLLNGCFEQSYFISFARRGGVSANTTRCELTAAPNGPAIVLQPSMEFRYCTEPDTSLLGMELSASALTRNAARLFGESFAINDKIAPPEGLALGAEESAALFRNLASAFREMEALEGCGLAEIAEAAVSELLSNLALVAMFPKLHRGSSVKAAGSGMIERARQYLEAHADTPLRMSELAQELGISLRAMQAGFQRRFGRSPTEYLFDCRLGLARQRLLDARPGVTIASIAMECGFVNLGAFAARYRRTFGELPSQTLGHDLRIRRKH